MPHISGVFDSRETDGPTTHTDRDDSGHGDAFRARGGADGRSDPTAHGAVTGATAGPFGSDREPADARIDGTH